MVLFLLLLLMRWLPTHLAEGSSSPSSVTSFSKLSASCFISDTAFSLSFCTPSKSLQQPDCCAYMYTQKNKHYESPGSSQQLLC